MRRFFLLMSLMLSLAMMANDKISAPTQLFMHDYAAGIVQQQGGKQLFSKIKSVKGIETIDCFISINGTSTAQLEALGVTITGRFDGMVTAQVPISKIEQVANLASVDQIAISQQAHHMTDQAKIVTKAVQAWDGVSNGLPQNFKGNGVVVGVIDTGIDFNHRAFYDSNGNTRIKAVYMPSATSANGGTHPVVGTTTLSGYHYTTPEQIANLTTDYNGESHGSHTSGCAGGSLVNGYAGMAPECDLVLCGLGDDMGQTSIANSAKYIANYAKSQGKPCVISISLGNNTGPHDGSSAICRAYDQVANQYGAIILLAAGNEADATGYATRTLSSESDAFVIMHENSNGGGNVSVSGYGTPIMDIWGRTNDPLTLKVLVVNKVTGAIAYTSDDITSGTTLNTTQLGQCFGSASVSIYFSTANNRKNIYIQPNVKNIKNSNYRLTYIVTSAAGNTIDAWSDGGYSSKIASTGKINGYTLTKGQADGTMCDDITGSRTISVGAMASRSNVNYPYSINDVAYFSSFGTDCNGVDHPFITAPGHYVISSLNGYDSSSTYGYSYRTSYNGRYHYWGQMSGTSMATPVAAGVVALLLQAYPETDLDGVREAIANTATAYVNPASPPKQRGHGIINAFDGVAYMLQQSITPRIIASKTEFNLTGYVGDTITTTVNLQGRNLTEGLTINIDGPGIYEVEPASLTNAEIMAGATLTIKFIPTEPGNTSASINLNSAGAEQVTLTVNGVAQPKTPTLNVNYSSLDMSAFAGGQATRTVRVSGMFISNDVTLTSDNEMFSASPSTIAASELEDGSYVTVTVTYAPTSAGNHSGTITLSSTGAQDATIAVTGTATVNPVAPHATDATQITGTSFIANWDPCPFATAYTLRVKPMAAASKLFTETFAKCENESSTNIANSLNNYTDNPGWAGSYVYQAVGGLRLGATSYNGILMTPALDFSSCAGKVSVKFSARAYETDTDCPLTVSCGDNAESIEIPTSDEGNFIVVLDCPSQAGQKIRFATTIKKKRVVITGVEIYAGDITDESTAGEPLLFEGITANNYKVTVLTPETTYIYDVRAFYGEEQSSWSNLIEVFTQDGGSPVHGDVNGDGYVTSADVTALYSYLLTGDTSSLVNGDQDGDGVITSGDVTTVYSVLLY